MSKRATLAAAGSGAEVTQYVAFSVDGRQFGIYIMSIGEIRQWTLTTPLPDQPEWNRGGLPLRGAIVPVHDLRARFGGELAEPARRKVVVVASIRGRSVGILVDAVTDILAVRGEDIRPLPPTVAEAADAAINGLVDSGSGVVALLDLDRLFPETP